MGYILRQDSHDRTYSAVDAVENAVAKEADEAVVGDASRELITVTGRTKPPPAAAYTVKDAFCMPMLFSPLRRSILRGCAHPCIVIVEENALLR